ncbi:MAG TPA: VWA domain-containing protein [Opitutaceae bacterium]
MSNWQFHDPLWFVALLALPVVAWLRRRRRLPVLVVPFAAEWHRADSSLRLPWQAFFAYAGVVLLIVALARPQSLEMTRETQQQGYDIVLAIDLSGSMLAEDYARGGSRINRLQAVKPVLEAFINRRSADRIGLVVFAGRAYTFAPLTFDHDWLRRQTGRLQIGLLEDGTAIGDGLGVALSRVEQGRKDEAFRREGAFVVLLTDGANNAGALDPLQAAAVAQERGVTVYTLGAGREGLVPMPVMNEQGQRIGTRQMMSDLDEGLLREIAQKTGGRYFRVADSDTIERAFAAIDQARKIEFEARTSVVTEELFAYLVLPGLALLVAAAIGATARAEREVLA